MCLHPFSAIVTENATQCFILCDYMFYYILVYLCYIILLHLILCTLHNFLLHMQPTKFGFQMQSICDYMLSHPKHTKYYLILIASCSFRPCRCRSDMHHNFMPFQCEMGHDDVMPMWWSSNMNTNDIMPTSYLQGGNRMQT